MFEKWMDLIPGKRMATTSELNGVSNPIQTILRSFNLITVTGLRFPRKRCLLLHDGGGHYR